MLKMALSSIQAHSYASLQIGEDTCWCDIGNGRNLPPYRTKVLIEYHYKLLGFNFFKK
jgi:hypothetical protein